MKTFTKLFELQESARQKLRYLKILKNSIVKLIFINLIEISFDRVPRKSSFSNIQECSLALGQNYFPSMTLSAFKKSFKCSRRVESYDCYEQTLQ